MTSRLTAANKHFRNLRQGCHGSRNLWNGVEKVWKKKRVKIWHCIPLWVRRNNITMPDNNVEYTQHTTTVCRQWWTKVMHPNDHIQLSEGYQQWPPIPLDPPPVMDGSTCAGVHLLLTEMALSFWSPYLGNPNSGWTHKSEYGNVNPLNFVRRVKVVSILEIWIVESSHYITGGRGSGKV